MNRRGFFRSVAGLAALVAFPKSVEQRQLKAVWTVECEYDLRSWHNLDAENELANKLAKEITDEIDREIMMELRAMV